MKIVNNIISYLVFFNGFLQFDPRYIRFLIIDMSTQDQFQFYHNKNNGNDQDEFCDYQFFVVVRIAKCSMRS